MNIQAKQVAGIQRGSYFWLDKDYHLYRNNRHRSENVKYVYCYFDRPIGRGSERIAHKCHAFGTVNTSDNIITLTQNHNHGPHKKYADMLVARNNILERVQREPGKTLRTIFEEERGSAHGLSFKSLYRTLRRLRPRYVIDLEVVNVRLMKPKLEDK